MDPTENLTSSLNEPGYQGTREVDNTILNIEGAGGFNFNATHINANRSANNSNVFTRLVHLLVSSEDNDPPNRHHISGAGPLGSRNYHSLEVMVLPSLLPLEVLQEMFKRIFLNTLGYDFVGGLKGPEVDEATHKVYYWLNYKIPYNTPKDDAAHERYKDMLFELIKCLVNEVVNAVQMIVALMTYENFAPQLARLERRVYNLWRRMDEERRQKRRPSPSQSDCQTWRVQKTKRVPYQDPDWDDWYMYFYLGEFESRD